MILQHLKSCTAAIFDLTGDARNGFYGSGLEMGLLIFQERWSNIFMVNLPTALQAAQALGAEEDLVPNIYGPLGSHTVLARRLEYYKVVDILMKASAARTRHRRIFQTTKEQDGMLDCLTLLTHPTEDSQLLEVEHKQWVTWKIPQLIELYGVLAAAGFKTDIARIFCVVFGVTIVRAVLPLQRASVLAGMAQWDTLEGEMRTIMDLGVFYVRRLEQDLHDRTPVVLSAAQLHWQAATDLIAYIDDIFITV